jgi:DNA-binding beta-propeller fold protein YncE
MLCALGNLPLAKLGGAKSKTTPKTHQETHRVIRRTVFFYPALLALWALSAGGCDRCGKGKGPLTPGAPIATPAVRAAYVTNNGSDSISVLDRDGDTVTTVPVDLDKGRAEAPHHLAVDAKEQRAFVALAFPPAPSKKKDPHAAHGRADDVGQLALLDLRDLSVQKSVLVDENPGDVILSRDRKKVLVTHYDMQRAMTVAAKGGGSPATMFAQLQVWDAGTLTLLGARPVCVAPHGMDLSPDDANVYIACYGSDELAVVDLRGTEFPVSRFPLGATPGVPGVPRYGPYSVAVSPGGQRVVVANLESSDLKVFDTKARAFAADGDVVLGARAFFPVFLDEDTLLVPTQAPDGLVRVDLQTHTVTRRAAFAKDQCELPHVVRQAKDKRTYVVCEGDKKAAGAVVEVDASTLQIKRRWAVGVYPDGIDFGD